MIDVHVVQDDSTGDLVNIDIVLIDFDAPGISKVQLVDLESNSLGNWDGGCASTLHYTASVNASELPVIVLAEECKEDGTPTGNVITFGPYLNAAAPGPELPELCTALVGSPPSAACSNAVSAAISAREAYLSDCEQYQHDNSALDNDREDAAIAYAATAAFAAAAIAAFASPPFGWIAGLVLAAAAIVSAYLAEYFTIKAILDQSHVDRDFAAVINDKSTFDLAADSVRSSCCPEHRDVDLSDLSCT